MAREIRACPVLVVDDDEITRSMLKHVLEAADYEVYTASGGNEAWEVLNRTGCRLVISDWMMPDGDGLQLCERIRQNDLFGYVYVILLTNRDKPEDIVQGLTAGADDFLTKPFNPDEIRVRVRAGERIITLEARDVAIFAMARLAESRDPETGAHLERMRCFCRILAEDLRERGIFPEVDESYVRMIYLTAPLHDIGKVGIPDVVLLKPGRLVDSEFEIMKTHTLIGAETLEAALRQYPKADYLQMAYDIALSHHERYDGSGYPRGLSGNDIPLSGRITALADVYDAISSARVYKSAFSHDVTREIIIKGEGTHFDPEVVESFRRTEDVFDETRRRLETADPSSLALQSA